MGKPVDLKWQSLYAESQLYKAAIRLYTKPLFNRQKACSTSHDHANLFDFARNGLENIGRIHKQLSGERFTFRPGQAVHHNFNGKHRTLYIYPWEERLVDLLIYRLLNQRFNAMFLPCSYAYRIGCGGVDACQNRLTSVITSAAAPLYAVKRDIRNYFDSIPHDALLATLERYVRSDDYLMDLLRQRVQFTFLDNGEVQQATRGVPFGTAIGCFLANLYLHDLDQALMAIPGVQVFRYADDILALTPDRERAMDAYLCLEETVERLGLEFKPSHSLNMHLTTESDDDPLFEMTPHFRHLGLEFCCDGTVRLSKDKGRKIRNLFKYAFKRAKGKLKRIKNPEKRARLAVNIARDVLDQGLRNVGIIDYYLKHVDDERQLKELDRWLAEEVLSIAFQSGHKKGNFRKLSFKRLRKMGLPSLVHRRRLIQHNHIGSSFFIWRTTQSSSSQTNNE